MNRIVVTGGLGFIGSHFVNRYKEVYPKSQITILDKFGIGSDVNNVTHADGVNIVHWDLINGMPDDLPPHIDAIFHFAAESHVDRSINDPSDFVKNNIFATLAVVEYVRKHPHTKLINISTDEVYGAFEDQEEGAWCEDQPTAPNSPYSASKAASDMLCFAYKRTFGTDVITTRCTNNFGIFQDDEKLIPTVIRCIVHEIPIPVYGTGMNVREWIPVSAHVNFIIRLSEETKRGLYHVTGGHELTNLALIDRIRKLCKKRGYTSELSFVEDRKGHDFRYAVDTLYPEYRNVLTDEEFNKYLEDTVDYYIRKYESEQTQL